MTRVLRAQPGHGSRCGGGRTRLSRAGAAVAAGEVRFKPHRRTPMPIRPLPVTLVMAVYKFDHMEWAIEKAYRAGSCGPLRR